MSSFVGFSQFKLLECLQLHPVPEAIHAQRDVQSGTGLGARALWLQRVDPSFSMLLRLSEQMREEKAKADSA